MPFRIYRQPYTIVTKSLAARCSSRRLGDRHRHAHGRAPWLVGNRRQRLSRGHPHLHPLFPSGSIFSVYQNGSSFSGPVSQPIFLLVGKPDKARGLATNSPTPNNYQDLDSKWVVINPQTGLVTVAPVAAGTDLPTSRQLGPRRPTHGRMVRIKDEG